MVIKIPMNESSSDVFMTSKEYSDCANIFKNTLNKYGLKKYSIEKYNDSKKLYEEILRDELKQSSNPRWIEFIFVNVNTEGIDVNKKKECYKELKENLKVFGSRFKYFGINAMKNDSSDDFYIRFMKSKPVSESYIDEWDQDILMENCIDEQVLQEMNFSKKDLQDPATIDKILKAKGVFENILKYTAFLFSALNIVAGIVVKVKFDIGGVPVIILLEAILIKIYSIAKDIPAKNYDKNIEKYKKQVQDLITKMEEKKESDPDNADKYQKVIDNCKAVLAEFDRRDKEAKNKALQENVKYIEDLYKEFKAFWISSCALGHTGAYDVDSLLIPKLYGIKESDIINHYAKNVKGKQYILSDSDYDYIFDKEYIEKAKKTFNNSRLFIFQSDDEYTKFIVESTKKVYETTGDKFNSTGVYDSIINSDYNKEALIEFDRIYGFYKFSKCPDAVKQKDFLEELNKKSSVKENADMVIDVNPAPVNEETSEIKESVETSITEGFGIDKSQKASLSDLELSYDRKFNAFCLSVSSYSPEKLRNTLIQKQNALADAQKEKKEAKDRYAKLAAQLKIDYLKNTIEKTNTLIKKKSKVEAKSAVATPRKKVSESVEVLNELFGKRWKSDKNARTESPKPPEPKRKYANLTKEEFEKCMSIIKTNVGKYPRLKKVINYDHNGCYSTYQKYIDFDEDEVVVAFLEWGEYDNEIKDEDKLDKFLNELDKDQSKCYASISKEFSQLSFKVEFETVPDAEFDCLCINSRKQLESTNEGFFEQKRNEDQKTINDCESINEANIINAIKYQIDKHFNKPLKEHKKRDKKNPKLEDLSINDSDDIEAVAKKLVTKLNEELKKSSYRELAKSSTFTYSDKEEDRNDATISNNYSLAEKGLIIYAYTNKKPYFRYTGKNPYTELVRIFNTVCDRMFGDGKVIYKRLQTRESRQYFVIYFEDDSERELKAFAKDLKEDKYFDSYEYPIEYLSDEDISELKKIKPFVDALMSKTSLKSIVNNNNFIMLYGPYGIDTMVDLISNGTIKPYLTEYFKLVEELNKLLDEANKNSDDNDIWNRIDEIDNKSRTILWHQLDKFQKEKIENPINSLKYQKLKSFDISGSVGGGSDRSMYYRMFIHVNLEQ